MRIHVPHENRDRVMDLMLVQTQPQPLVGISRLLNMGYERVRRAVASLVDDKMMMVAIDDTILESGRQGARYRVTLKAKAEAHHIHEYLRSIATLAPESRVQDTVTIDKVLEFMAGRKDKMTISKISNLSHVEYQATCRALWHLIRAGKVVKHVRATKVKGRNYSLYAVFRPEPAPPPDQIIGVPKKPQQHVKNVPIGYETIEMLRPHTGNPFGPLLALYGVAAEPQEDPHG